MTISLETIKERHKLYLKAETKANKAIRRKHINWINKMMEIERKGTDLSNNEGWVWTKQQLNQGEKIKTPQHLIKQPVQIPNNRLVELENQVKELIDKNKQLKDRIEELTQHNRFTTRNKLEDSEKIKDLQLQLNKTTNIASDLGEQLVQRHNELMEERRKPLQLPKEQEQKLEVEVEEEVKPKKARKPKVIFIGQVNKIKVDDIEYYQAVEPYLKKERYYLFDLKKSKLLGVYDAIKKKVLSLPKNLINATIHKPNKLNLLL